MGCIAGGGAGGVDGECVTRLLVAAFSYLDDAADFRDDLIKHYREEQRPVRMVGEELGEGLHSRCVLQGVLRAFALLAGAGFTMNRRSS